MKYRIGQKVVYVGPACSNHPRVISARLKVPRRGGVYTIRGGMDCHPSSIEGEPGYLLEEIINRSMFCPVARCVMELHIDEKYLRPVVDRKTDISALQEICRESTVEVPNV